MMRIQIIALILTFLPLAAAQAANARSEILTAEETSVPIGWVEYCKNYESDCQTYDRNPQKIKLTAPTLAKIQKINKQANGMVNPTTDLDHWGVQDQWDIPTSLDPRADCEDIALLKRKMLEKAGIPRSAILLTVVNSAGERHVVLTLKTDSGDLILDNLTDDIDDYEKVAHQRENRYEFVKMQADYNENLWLRIVDSAEPQQPPQPPPSATSRLNGLWEAVIAR